MIMAVSLRKDGKVGGHDFKQQVAKTDTASVAADTMRTTADGTIVINTTGLGKDIIGYAGTVPLEIYLKDNKVIEVKALKNSETPDFFDQASVLLSKWNGKTTEEASALKVDAVSGATFTSKAIIGNVQRGLQYAGKSAKKESIWASFDLTAKSIAGLIVALMAAIMPLFIKNRNYRLFQLALNVIVLGFWCGTFLSYSSLIGYMSNGMNVVSLLVPLIMLIVAFIYPLFGKKTYYCTNVCPFGSLQELTGKCVKNKIKMSAKWVKNFDKFRQVLWAVLMVCLWTGAWFDWIDYEPFSAFIVQSASWFVIVIALVFIALSTVIVRPYCRFVCPTGTLLKISQKSK